MLLDPNQVENMLALGPFPRFAGTMVKNIETSWKKVVEGIGVEDTGGENNLTWYADFVSCNFFTACTFDLCG